MVQGDGREDAVDSQAKEFLSRVHHLSGRGRTAECFVLGVGQLKRASSASMHHVPACLCEKAPGAGRAPTSRVSTVVPRLH